ncbi:PAS domain S-box protein [Sphingomonas sp. R86521]|uniref:PAS domain S-box protein n=1 Tax=Sphingomonas sp. R86521 TaxID=3093860 RepID=UPI0036D260E0
MSGTTMPRLGIVAIDDAGTIVRADHDFAATMRVGATQLTGRNLLDFTAPADRERCIFLLDKLLHDGEPVATTKRLIRADGSHEWVCYRMSCGLAEHDAIRIEIDVETAAAPSDWVDPAMLLHVAKLMIHGRRARSETFSAALFVDPAWDILLAAYVREAEGGMLTTAELEGEIGISAANAARWMRALNAEGLLEFEHGDGVRATTVFRLSCDAHQKFERFLSDRYHDATRCMRDDRSED